MSDLRQSIYFQGSGLNSDDSLEVMPLGDSPTTFTLTGRQNVIIPPDNYGKLEDAWGTTLVAGTDLGLSTLCLGHVVDTDGKWCYYFLTGTSGSLDTNSIVGVNLREPQSVVRQVMIDEVELELDSTIVFKKASYIDGWIYWASGQYGPKKVNVTRAINFTTYKSAAWDSADTYAEDAIVLCTDGGIYTANAAVSAVENPPNDNSKWDLTAYAYPNTALSGTASLLDGAFDLVDFPPLTQVTGTYGDDTSRLYNNLRGKLFQFTYRWKYRDSGFTVTAPFSELFLSPDVESFDGEILNSFCTNNVITLSFNGGSEVEVEYVELFVRMGQELSWQYVDKIDGGTNTYSFYNDFIMEVADDDTVNKLDNYIPRETRALELLSENVLVLGGNKYGFANVNPNVTLTVGWENVVLNAVEGTADATYGVDAEVYDDLDELYYNKIVIPSIALAGVGDILKIHLEYPTFIINESYVLLSGDVDTEAHFRNRCISIINSEGLGEVRAGYATPPTGLTLTNPADFYVSYWDIMTRGTTSYIKIYTTTAATVMNKWSQFTAGARHVFGITYFDRAMRPFAIASDSSTDVYVKTVPEEKGGAEDYDWKNYIDWEILHEAPAEAKYWQWFYAGNQNIDDFWFYVIAGAAVKDGSTTELEIDITPLQTVQTGTVNYPMSQVGPYVWQKGDRMRAITNAVVSGGDYGTLCDTNVDLEIKGLDTGTNKITVATTGSGVYGLAADCLIEIYRPKTVANDDLFYAFGPIRETCAFSGNVYHMGDTLDQTGETAGTGAQGRFSEGDSYLIARAFNVAVGSADTSDLFLVESPSYSDFYDSDWYFKGKINIRSNIGEVELNNLAISNKLIQDTGINGLCTFEYDDIVALPDKNGKVNALRQIGNVLRVIQQRKRTSFYVGMQEFYDQSGNVNLVKSDDILGNGRELDGDWGTENPETVVVVDDMIYFWDLHNRAFVQDSENGAVAISNNKMRQYFIDFGDEIVEALYLGNDYTLACDYHSTLQTLCFYYYIEDIGCKILLYHLPSKRWISPLTGLEGTTTTITVKYGYLYNWFAAADVKNIAAAGWHVPTFAEWGTLQIYLGGESVAGGKLKETGTTYWLTPNTSATNETGFNARGNGQRSQVNGAYSVLNVWCFYWASNGLNAVSGYRAGALKYNSASFAVNSAENKSAGHALRLIKDSTSLTHGQTATYTGNNGHVYSSICIGTQEWLFCNLIETKYRDGTSIPEVTNSDTWDALTTGARCSYDNDEDNAFTTATTLSYNVGGLIGAENRFFVVDEGKLYLMDSDSDRREFIGNTTKAEGYVTVVGNAEPLLPKIVDTVGLMSNEHTAWAVDTITIPADPTTIVDQSSKALSADWLTREGVTRAPVKRNMYTSGVYAYKDLWEGEKMRGRVVKVTFTLPTQTSGHVDVVAFEIGMTVSK